MGLMYQNHYNIDPVYQETKKQYQVLIKKEREEARQAYLNSISGWQRFKEEIMRLSKIHHFSPNVPIAQCALESARGTSYFAINRNNFCGIGAYDHDPNQAFTFESPEAHANYWVKLIKNNYKSAWQVRNKPYDMVVKIKQGGYASSPTYVTKVTSMAEFKSL